jgi:hypothetical protein
MYHVPILPEDRDAPPSPRSHQIFSAKAELSLGPDGSTGLDPQSKIGISTTLERLRIQHSQRSLFILLFLHSITFSFVIVLDFVTFNHLTTFIAQIHRHRQSWFHSLRQQWFLQWPYLPPPPRQMVQNLHFAMGTMPVSIKELAM